MIENECLYFCADDTHGTPVMLKAKELNVTPQELIKKVQKDHQDTYKLYNINFTNFHSTHSDENKSISEDNVHPEGYFEHIIRWVDS